MFDLNGKLALVTGSTRGIGKAIALALANAGADVIIHGRKMSEAAKETAEELKKAGHFAGFIPADMNSVEEIENMYVKIEKDFGKLDILVNNAAALTRVPFMEMTVNDWDFLMETNARGYFLSTQSAAKLMIKNRFGRIINISSISQYVASKNRVHYCASKGAIGMLTKGAALELAEYGITVNEILPGSIHTDFNNDVLSNPEFYKQKQAAIPCGRLGKAEDISGAAVYLASDEASYVNGAELVIDGAMTIYN